MLKIKTLRVDDENDMHIRVTLCGDLCSSSLDIWIDGSDLFKDFAMELTEFPYSREKQVVFEYGEDDPKWAYYLKLTISQLNYSSECLVNVISNKKGNNTEQYRCEFPIHTHLHTLNRLGKELLYWKPIEGEIWSFE